MEFDSTVTMAFLAGLLTQTMVIVWGVAKFVSRVAVLENVSREIAEKQDALNRTLAVKTEDLTTRIARIEGILTGQFTSEHLPRKGK